MSDISFYTAIAALGAIGFAAICLVSVLLYHTVALFGWGAVAFIAGAMISAAAAVILVHKHVDGDSDAT